MAKSVSKAVREILFGLSFLNYAFEKKLVNESSLARLIKERVEEKTARQASLGSITAAVRRFILSFKPAKIEKNFVELLKSSKLELRTGLVEIHLKRNQSVLEKLAAVEKKVNYAHGEKMYLLKRSQELTVVAEETYLPEIIACAPKRDLLSTNKERAIITIHYDPYYFAESFGGLHFYTGQFAILGIGIYLIFSTYSATSFVVHEKDASLAYKSLSASLGEITAVYENK